MNEKITYIHYFQKGSENTIYQKEKIEPIKNHGMMRKPIGGFWASQVDSIFGWKDWCGQEDYMECDEEYSFTFTLKETAKVASIHVPSDINSQLPLIAKCDHGVFGFEYHIDFEKCVQNGIDAIELYLYKLNQAGEPCAKMLLYWGLYGWDCDSILILNPDIIVPN